MKNSAKSNLNTFLKIDYRDKDSLWLTSGLTLRKLIGILGMGLPAFLFFFLYTDSGLSYPLPSISHYYYTRVSSIFILVMGLLAVFLIIYKGKEPVDFYISLTAGVFALLVIFFPTYNITDICCDIDKQYAVTILRRNDFREKFHIVSAGIFMMCLSYMSLFLFTKSDKKPDKRGTKKILRNRIYRICGVTILIAILVMIAGFIGIIPASFYDEHHITFWMETIAVESFGFSWLIKGETLFKD